MYSKKQVQIPKNYEKKKKLPDVRKGTTYKFRSTISLYVIVNKLENRIVEVFVNMGKAGSTLSTLNKALGRVISVALQHDSSLVNKIIDTLEGMSGDLTLVNDELGMASSVPDAIARVLKAELGIESENVEVNIEEASNLTLCPVCGKLSLRRSGSCRECLNCGYSSC